MSSLNQEEVEKFSRIADQWWDENSKFKPLHKFNPVRISYIRRKICEHFNLDNKLKQPFSDIKIIDIGCGGGLVAENFAKMNAKVLGIDASEKNINVAKIHAEKENVTINYQQSLVEDLITDKKYLEQYDVVFALEIVEHVDNATEFLTNCTKLLKKNGILFIATINRNIKSLLTAKIGAEYILNWLEKGTHDYKKFLKPSEIYNIVKNQVELKESCGFVYNLFKDSWREDQDDLDINYIMVFEKK